MENQHSGVNRDVLGFLKTLTKAPNRFPYLIFVPGLQGGDNLYFPLAGIEIPLDILRGKLLFRNHIAPSGKKDPLCGLARPLSRCRKLFHALRAPLIPVRKTDTKAGFKPFFDIVQVPLGDCRKLTVLLPGKQNHIHPLASKGNFPVFVILREHLYQKLSEQAEKIKLLRCLHLLRFLVRGLKLKIYNAKPAVFQKLLQTLGNILQKALIQHNGAKAVVFPLKLRLLLSFLIFLRLPLHMGDSAFEHRQVLGISLKGMTL